MISDADLELVRWVAGASVGMLLPESYRHRSGTSELIRRLVDVGVVRSVRVGQPIDMAAVAAQRDCQEWLAEHELT
jgi:hypothetical protein